VSSRQPPGLFLLFGVEMWERFSYYGMRAFLVLFLVSTAGGFGWSKQQAANLYGWYTGLVYLTPLFGGYLADRFLGTHRALIIGGIVIASGHFCLAVPAGQLLPRARAHHSRNGILQVQHLDHGGAALSAQRPAPRLRVYHLLHGDQQARRSAPSSAAIWPRASASAGTGASARLEWAWWQALLLPALQEALSARHRRRARGPGR